VQRVEGVRALAAEIVRPLSQLRAIILQASASPGEVAVFLFENSLLRGPAAFSTLGMRIQNEQSGSSSLFAQPLAIEPIPEEQGPGEQGNEGTEEQGVGNREQGTRDVPPKIPRTVLESRLESALASLTQRASPTPAHRQASLALLKRWYYRPESRRTGEIFFPGADDRWPLKAILRGIGRVAAKSLTSTP
jgi:excinuclease ABC subunit C